MDGINNATSFVRFMETVWEMNCEPHDNGVTLHGNPMYDEWHNAVLAARHFGARHTGNTQVNGEHWYLYRFPNGSAVAISHDGGAVVERRPYRYSPKPRKE